jgi:hypothetical protein
MMTKRIKNTVESLSGLPKVSVIYNETNILLRYNKCFYQNKHFFINFAIEIWL